MGTLDLMWRIALLAVVFGADAVVFIGLLREEIRDWRLGAQPQSLEEREVTPL